MTTKRPYKDFVKLFCAMVIIAVTWCYLLPLATKQPVVRQRIDFLDDKGIDPTAMFYTDLEIMDEIIAKNDRCN